MEETQGLPVATHLLQHTLRSLCMDSQWVYAVFWRIIPRSYPPPRWDAENGVYDRSKGNKRNWILAWEDGFCDFSECAKAAMTSNTGPGLQPELFFKMSHEVYNFGEGLMGKVSADNSHKWIFRDPLDHEINFLSPWHNSIDPHPRTWEAQFRSGIQTIAVIAVREGLVQLGAIQKVLARPDWNHLVVIEDLNFVIHLQRKFNYLLAIPGVFLPHPSSSLQSKATEDQAGSPWQLQGESSTRRHLEKCVSWNGTTMMVDQNQPQQQMASVAGPVLIDTLPHQQLSVTPSMSSLQALLSKLPSVTPSQYADFNNLSSPSVPRHHYSSELTHTSMFMNPQEFQLPAPPAASRPHDFIEEFHNEETDGTAACTGMDQSYLSEVVD